MFLKRSTRYTALALILASGGSLSALAESDYTLYDLARTSLNVEVNTRVPDSGVRELALDPALALKPLPKPLFGIFSVLGVLIFVHRSTRKVL